MYPLTDLMDTSPISEYNMPSISIKLLLFVTNRKNPVIIDAINVFIYCDKLN
jgi:hypothetical protein